jgi:uroporphyrinogen-III synthase
LETSRQCEEVVVHGLRVAVTAARRGAELVSLLERRGAAVVWAPTVGPDCTSPEAALIAQTDAVIAAGPAWVVASTGVGMRAWIDVAQRHQRYDALVETLRGARVVARGAKANGAVQALGVSPVFVSPQETDEDVAAWVKPRLLSDDSVAIQLHGGGRRDPYREVQRAAGTTVFVDVYRTAPPADGDRARRLVRAIADRTVHAVTFTSPAAARNLFEIGADQADALRAAFSSDVAAVTIGAVTSAALEDLGVAVALMPTRPRTADLVRALHAWWDRREVLGDTAPHLRLQPQAGRVVAGDRIIDLGDREFAVLASLVRRPGLVCDPATILREAWGSSAPDDPAAVKHHIGRLRRKLGAAGSTLQTVRGVGYRYDPAKVACDEGVTDRNH